MTNETGSPSMTSEAEIFHKTPHPVVGKVVPTTLGSMSFTVLREAIEQFDLLRLQKGAEIGVYRGQTSEYLLRRFPDLRMVCVDPFVDYSEHEPDRDQAYMSECEQAARSKLSPYADRVKIYKDYSVSAAKQFDDHSFDFVFIDAIHSYEAVTEDLEAWFPKVRPGGLVSGHDFSWPGVKEALEDFLKPRNLVALHSPSVSDVWLLPKWVELPQG